MCCPSFPHFGPYAWSNGVCVLLPLKWCLQCCLLWLLCSTEQSNSVEKEEQNKPQENLNHKLHGHRLDIE